MTIATRRKERTDGNARESKTTKQFDAWTKWSGIHDLGLSRVPPDYRERKGPLRRSSAS